MIWFGLVLLAIGLVSFALGFFLYHDAPKDSIGLAREHKDFGWQLMFIAVLVATGSLFAIGYGIKEALF